MFMQLLAWVLRGYEKEKRSDKSADFHRSSNSVRTTVQKHRDSVLLLLSFGCSPMTPSDQSAYGQSFCLQSGTPTPNVFVVLRSDAKCEVLSSCICGADATENSARVCHSLAVFLRPVFTDVSCGICSHIWAHSRTFFKERTQQKIAHCVFRWCRFFSQCALLWDLRRVHHTMRIESWQRKSYIIFFSCAGYLIHAPTGFVFKSSRNVHTSPLFSLYLLFQKKKNYILKFSKNSHLMNMIRHLDSRSLAAWLAFCSLPHMRSCSGVNRGGSQWQYEFFDVFFIV